MKLIKIGDHVWQGTRMWVMNCYFVQEADGLTVIDTLMAGSGRAIVEAAAKIGAPIKRIALTHAHVDHAGSIDELAGLLPGVTLATSERAVPFLQGEVALRPDESSSKLNGSFVQVQKAVDLPLHDGDPLGSLTVIRSPGHSPDHIAYFDGRDGTLIAGDAFQTQGGLAVSGMLRLLFPLPAMATWDKPLALASAKKLVGLNPTCLAVGHGPALSNPVSRMNEAIRKAEQKWHG